MRPTPDRAKETVFNWLGNDLSGYSCLDLFAGTGAMGIEALSRGASRVDFLEKEKSLGYFIKNGKYWKHLADFDQKKIDILDGLWNEVIHSD